MYRKHFEGQKRRFFRNVKVVVLYKIQGEFMLISKIIDYLQNIGIENEVGHIISDGLLIIFILILCLLGNLIVRNVVLRLVTKLVKNNKYKWDDRMLERKVFHRLANFTSPLIISFFMDFFPKHQNWIKRGLSAYVMLVGLLVIDALLNAIDDIYRTYEISKIKPIKGFLQVVKIVIFIIGGIFIIAVLIGESPMILLGGIGALTAVFMLVFQSSILGFVAGIQLTSNDMVRIGDWIEMPKYDANGTVVDLSLNTVKVQNFDRTITTIPAHAMISDSFKNWRGMEASGGRRIMRSIHIDIRSISFCTDEMLQRFKKIEYLKDYIENKQIEIEEYNQKRNIDLSEKTNGRRLTNIGVFRFYILNYLKNHPGIHQNMTLMVRQLSPEAEGLPIEIYAFTNGTNWVAYENIQSDIFDHLFAVVPEFGLRVFQDPTGYDIQSGFSSTRKL